MYYFKDKIKLNTIQTDARITKVSATEQQRQKQQQQQKQQHPAAASAATATDSKTYRQPVWQAAGLAGLLLAYFQIFPSITFQYYSSALVS